jgi:hypothetical protein
VSKPIGGLGKLPPGRLTLEVLSVVRHPTGTDLLLAAPTGETHYERVADWPREWDAPGTKVQATIEPTSGAAMSRNGGRYQGVDAKTRAPLTDWSDDPAQVLTWLRTRGVATASTCLVEVRVAERVFAVHMAAAGEARAVAPDSPPPSTDPAGDKLVVDDAG